MKVKIIFFQHVCPLKVAAPAAYVFLDGAKTSNKSQSALTCVDIDKEDAGVPC